jgi:shikimate dehydrogenase
MDSFPGSPVPVGAFPQAAWVFDAVYTPVDAPFRARTQAARARFLPGWGLFFHQRVDAVEIFTGHRLDAEALTALRARLRVLETEPPRRLSGGT